MHYLLHLNKGLILCHCSSSYGSHDAGHIFNLARVNFVKKSILLRSSAQLCTANVAKQLSPIYHNYIVLRAGMLNDLLYTYHSSTWINDIDKVTLDFFKKCCVYVGKGKGSRKFQHVNRYQFKSTLNCSSLHTEIREEWRQGGGVVILHLHPEINNFEAHCREFALIKATGLDNLCNSYNGVAYGMMKHGWTNDDIITFGNMLFYNALIMCINDPPDVIMPYHCY